jgi:preprotein translocase subunit YajC
MNFPHHLLNLLILAQQEGAQPDGAPAADPAGAPANGEGGGFGGIFNSALFPLILIGIIFYFLLILPERKKRKELENQLNSLKKNDQVVTTGGIVGVIVNANPGSRSVTVRIDDSNNVKIEVLRSHIAHVGPIEKADGKEIKEKKDA